MGMQRGRNAISAPFSGIERYDDYELKILSSSPFFSCTSEMGDRFPCAFVRCFTLSNAWERS